MDKNEVVNSPTIEELTAKNAELEKQNEVLQAKLKWLEEQFRLSQHKKFGTSSEKTNPDQLELLLFNEAERTANPIVEEPTLETITYRRKNMWDSELRNLKTCLRKRSIIVCLKKSRCVCVAVKWFMK